MRVRVKTIQRVKKKIQTTHPGPGIAAAYNKVVKAPMDFKTIETKRLPFYTLADLQDISVRNRNISITLCKCL